VKPYSGSRTWQVDTNVTIESGLIVFKLIEGQLAHTDVQLEVLMDDHVFPAYTSQKVKTRHAVFNDGEYTSLQFRYPPQKQSLI
jgi:Ca2+-dependent lipid-binding protein